MTAAERRSSTKSNFEKEFTLSQSDLSQSHPNTGCLPDLENLVNLENQQISLKTRKKKIYFRTYRLY